MAEGVVYNKMYMKKIFLSLYYIKRLKQLNKTYLPVLITEYTFSPNHLFNCDLHSHYFFV